MSHKKTVGNLALARYEDIFKSSMGTPDGERVVEMQRSKLRPPEFHPFQVRDDLAMQRLVRSVKKYGVLEPGIVRPRVDGNFELLVGNRRDRACELAGRGTLPVIIRELDDDNAVILMVDSNLEQREKLLFSEKAWAYRVKLEALNHSGVKSDMLSVEVLIEQTGESKNQIFRFVRLTELIITLLDRVDARQLAFNPAVELSYLSHVEQTAVAEMMDKYEIKPSLSQAVRLKKMKQSAELSSDVIERVLAEDKKLSKGDTIADSRYRRFFPSNYSQKQIDTIIVKLLADWKAGAVV